MSEIIERLLTYMEYEHINDNQMTVTAGLSNGTIGKARSGVTKSLNSDNLEKILNAYPNLSADWLLTGRGEMLKTNCAPESTPYMEQPHPSNKDSEKTANSQENTLIISEFLSTIRQQAEEIGRLKAHIEELERRRGDNAGDAQNSAIAAAG